MTGEDERLERVLPLVRKYGAAVVAISNDETGISEDPDVRFAVAKQIVERAADHGIPREDIVVDPLRDADRGDARRPAGRSSGSSAGCATSSASTAPAAPRTSASGCRTARASTAPFLAMAIASGLTSAITNPLLAEVRQSVMAADVLLGNDPDCGRWIRTLPGRAGRRRAGPPGEPPARRGRGLGRRLTGRGRADRGRRPARCRPADALVVFTPSGRRGRFAAGHDRARRRALARRRHRLGLRRPRDLRPLPGRARAIGAFPKHGIDLERRAPLGARQRSRRPTGASTGWPPTGG